MEGESWGIIAKLSSESIRRNRVMQMAIAEGGRRGAVRYLRELPTGEATTRKLVAKLAPKYSRLSFCYEAGPTGYGLHRLITSLDHECLVAAPSSPRRNPATT
jgi:transposase